MAVLIACLCLLPALVSAQATVEYESLDPRIFFPEADPEEHKVTVRLAGDVSDELAAWFVTVRERKPLGGSDSVRFPRVQNLDGLFVVRNDQPKDNLRLLSPALTGDAFSWRFEETSSSHLVAMTSGDYFRRRKRVFEFDMTKKSVCTWEMPLIALRLLKLADEGYLGVFDTPDHGRLRSPLLPAFFCVGVEPPYNFRFVEASELYPDSKQQSRSLSVREEPICESQPAKYECINGVWETVEPEMQAHAIERKDLEKAIQGKWLLSDEILDIAERHTVDMRRFAGAAAKYLIGSSDCQIPIRYGELFPGVIRLVGVESTFYPLPQPDRQLVEEKRHDYFVVRYKNDAPETIANDIGPWQVDSRYLIFGLQNNQGEGQVGVGGWGTFDFVKKRFAVYYPKEMVDYSVSAMLVERDGIWFGLCETGESLNVPHGLIYLDRHTHEIFFTRIPEVVTAIHRSGKALFLSSTDGLFIMDDDGVTETDIQFKESGEPYFTRRPLRKDDKWLSFDDAY